MGRTVDKSLWRAWRERLARYEASGQSVAVFCGRERVSVAAFYQWRRKLAGQPGRLAAASNASAESTSLARRPGRAGAHAAAFVPVRIESSSCVELLLVNGTRVRVPTQEVAAIQAVVLAAGQLSQPGAMEGTSC